MVSKDHKAMRADECFRHLLGVMSSKQFLEMKSLGGELPIYIAPYEPRKAFEIEEMVCKLVSHLAQQGLSVVHIDIYELAMDILKEKKIFPVLIKKESEYPKETLQRTLRNTIKTEQDVPRKLTETIQAETIDGKPDILILSGVGKVFPYLRSHNILNNIESVTKGFPTVLFFPGEYRVDPVHGSSLDVFGLFSSGGYYRAINIYHCECPEA